MIASASEEDITQTAQHHTWIGRAFLWCAVFIASRLPEVLCRELGFTTCGWISPLYETFVLISLALVATKLCPSKHFAGFILATAALTYSWRVVVPWIESSVAFVSLLHNLSWGAQFFVLRLTRTVGAVCLLFTLLGSGISRSDLFLQTGNLKAPVKSEPFWRIRRPISWARFSLTLLLIFCALLAPYLYWTLDPQRGHVERLLFALPWAVATSALNAANEEFQFRSVLLARLTSIVSSKESFLLVATVFGVAHYFGQPCGWGGLFLAVFAGWIWAKSMVETRGFACAFLMHFVLDIIIFCFLAMSATDLTSAWS